MGVAINLFKALETVLYAYCFFEKCVFSANLCVLKLQFIDTKPSQNYDLKNP
jgi:hypothetical protein